MDTNLDHCHVDHPYAPTAVMDGNYLMVGNNLDVTLQEKIKRGEYVDFALLLTRDRSMHEHDHQMELINKGGQTFFVPVADHEVAGMINNIHKWEQAFRIYSNVYLKANPERATELIQYNHTINSAANSYMWENVYAYDKEFRIHMGQYLTRSWLIILQQAWTMLLKDRVKFSDGNSKAGNSPGNFSKKDICKRFNKRLCTAGMGCRYEHHCFECGKFGHGEHICRKRLAKSHHDQKNNHGHQGGSMSGALKTASTK